MTVRMTDGHALPFDPKLPGNSSSSTSSHKGNPLVRCSALRNCMEFLRRAPTGQHDDIVASY